MWQMELLFFILGYFLPFYPPNSPKNQNFEKMKKTPGDIIILHKCIKNHDHMLYCSWDMACDRCNYFSFWAIFCPFTPLTPKNIKILKEQKKHLEVSSFYINVPKIMTICYTGPEIWCVTDVVIFHFGLFLPFQLPNSPKSQNFSKMKKTPRDIITLHMCAKNYDHMLYWSWDMVCDGWTENAWVMPGCPN